MENRKARRQSKIQGKPKVYTLNEFQIKQLKEKAVKESTYKAFIIMMGLPLMVLHDKFGFGKTRLTKFSDEIFGLYDSYEKEYVTLEDIIKTIEEETGVKFSFERSKN